MKSEWATWRDEIARPKRTIAQRLALWVGPPAPAPQPPTPDPYRWWSADELIAAAQSLEQPQ